jgi:hypothetical protein
MILFEKGEKFSMTTDISISIFTTKAEIDNLKKGSTILLGWIEGYQPEDAIYRISTSLDACEIVDKQVRVNTTVVQQSIKQMGEVIGSEIGKQLQLVFAQLKDSFK